MTMIENAVNSSIARERFVKALREKCHAYGITVQSASPALTSRSKTHFALVVSSLYPPGWYATRLLHVQRRERDIHGDDVAEECAVRIAADWYRTRDGLVVSQDGISTVEA